MTEFDCKHEVCVAPHCMCPRESVKEIPKHIKEQMMITEPLLAKLRYDMNPTFTTSEFKENALDYDIESDEAQQILSHMIKRGFIKRVKTGHYEKTDRYINER